MALYLHETGTGPPILFLHGWTMTGAAFANQFALLGDRFHCLAPDLPGHGQSAGPANTATSVTQLNALLADRDLRDVTLVGWSLGAMIAWHLIAADTDKRVARMVSVDMSPHPRRLPNWRYGIRNDQPGRMSARIVEDWPATARAISQGMFAQRHGTPDMAAQQAEAMILSNNPMQMAAFWQDLMAADAREIVAQLPVPMLVTHGTKSRVYLPEVADWLTSAAPHATQLAFKISGHSPHLEEPELFAETLASFAQPQSN